jgi:transcriptional regulator with XRE-family HTH domain
MRMNAKSPDRVDIEVGRRIRMQRLAIGMSQSELAGALGVTFQQLQKYEKGVNRVGAGRLTRIAHKLDVGVAQLLGVEGGKAAPRAETGHKGEALELLTRPGAIKLLRAFQRISNDRMRRSVVKTVESIVAQRD